MRTRMPLLMLGLAAAVTTTGGEPVKAPRPRPNILTRYLDRADIHPAVHVGEFVVFPISLSETNTLGNVLAMDQALAKKLLVIEELGSARVPEVKFTNKSPDKRVFLMAGELIAGGKQNRTLTTDALLGPKSSVALPVYCVQRGRWAGEAEFAAGSTVVPQAVRRRAVAKAGQDEVWAEVGRANKRLKSSTASDDLAAAMTRKENVEALDKLRGRIAPKLPTRCVGVVVARDGQIIGADLFNSAELFAAMRDKVLNSFLSQHLHATKPARSERKAPATSPTQQQVRDYLQACYTARFQRAQLRGIGQVFDIRGTRYGQTLALESATRGPADDSSHRRVERARHFMIHTALMEPVVPVKPDGPPRRPVRPER